MSMRYFSGRGFPVLRIDAHTPADFYPLFQKFFALQRRLYILVFEREPGEEAGLINNLRSRIPIATVVEREGISDLLGRNIISIYVMTPLGP